VDLAERPQDPVEEPGRFTSGQTAGEFPERDIQKLLDHLRADGACSDSIASTMSDSALFCLRGCE
jgi:hypothetical protein